MEEHNIVMPDQDMVLDASGLIQSTEAEPFIANLPQADPAAISRDQMDSSVVTPENSETRQMDTNIQPTAGNDFANCRKSGNEFICDFKKVLVNQQNSNGNKVFVEAGGKLTLITPKITGKYKALGNYDLKFTAGEKANIYLKGEAKFKKKLKFRLWDLMWMQAALGKLL